MCGAANGSILFTTTNLTDGTYILAFKKAGTDTSASVTVSNHTFNLSGLGAASYSAFILNPGGCAGSLNETVVLSDPAAPAASITPIGPTELCEDDLVTLTATQAAGYLWSTGDTTRTITVNKEGNYSVTITSAQGCSSQAQIDPAPGRIFRPLLISRSLFLLTAWQPERRLPPYHRSFCSPPGR